MPAKKGRQIGATDRRNANDAGLIAPGRRVTKQRSIHALNASTTQPAAPVASSSLPAQAHAPSVHDATARSSRAQEPFPDDEPLGPQILVSTAAHAQHHEAKAREDVNRGQANGAMPRHASSADLAHTQFHQSWANGNGTRDHTSHTASTGDAVVTLVGPHCRLDMLAMFLLMLQLPPLVQLLVQFGFIWMTIGNPSASWYSVSLPSLLTWSRSYGGNPSVMVSLIANTLFLCIWALLPIGKDFVLRLAPAVMAASLGGGNVRRKWWKHAILCTLFVALHELLAYEHNRQMLLNTVWMVLSKLSFSPVQPIDTTPLASPPAASVPPPQNSPTWRWWNYLLMLSELHIVTHGCIRIIRRWFDNQSTAAATRPVARTDHDSSPHAHMGQMFGVPPDISLNGHGSASTDGRPPGPPPVAQTRASSGKRRKKQANLARSQQPFWAATAFTLIYLSGEKEPIQLKKDRAASGVAKPRRLGDPDCLSDAGGWITNIKDTELWFNVGLPADLELSESLSKDAALASKPIDVRVNGMHWPPFKLRQISSGLEHGSITAFGGKIFGLTPSSSYKVELVCGDDNKIIYSATLSTTSSESSPQGVDLSHPMQDSLHPLSPVSTLRSALARDEAWLSDQRSKSTRTRKSHQQATRNLKQEVDTLRRGLDTHGSDERQKNRKLQFENHISQNDDAAAAFAQELESLGNIPQSTLETFNQAKARNAAASQRLAELKDAAELAKKEAERAIMAAHNESAKNKTKKAKADGRLAALHERHKATSEAMDAKRTTKAANETMLSYNIAQQRKHVNEARHNLTLLNAQRQDVDSRIVDLHRQLPMDNPYTPAYPAAANPHTPELAYANVNVRAPYAFPGPVLSPQTSMRTRPRARSSSMLSSVSGFTENLNGATQHSLDDTVGPFRNGSGSSGSHREALNANPARLSPIGAEVGRGSPRQRR